MGFRVGGCFFLGGASVFYVVVIGSVFFFFVSCGLRRGEGFSISFVYRFAEGFFYGVFALEVFIYVGGEFGFGA